MILDFFHVSFFSIRQGSSINILHSLKSLFQQKMLYILFVYFSMYVCILVLISRNVESVVVYQQRWNNNNQKIRKSSRKILKSYFTLLACKGKERNDFLYILLDWSVLFHLQTLWRRGKVPVHRGGWLHYYWSEIFCSGKTWKCIFISALQEYRCYDISKRSISRKLIIWLLFSSFFNNSSR